MELRQLRYFVAIFEERSISKAAARFDIAQSATSAQLAHLEAELGLDLFVRTSTGVEPTAAGRALFDRAQMILRQVNDTRSAVRSFNAKPKGIVAVSIADIIAQVLGAPLLRAVTERFPEIVLVLNADVALSPSDNLSNSCADLWVLYFDGQLNGYVGRQIASERLFLIAKRKPQCPSVPAKISLSEALRKPLILPGGHHGIRRQVEHVAKTRALRVEHLAAEINSLAITKAAIHDGAGSAILPISSVAAEVDGGLMCAQELVDPSASVTLSLYATKEIMASAAAFSVYRLISSVAKDLVDRAIWRGAHSVIGAESMERGR